MEPQSESNEKSGFVTSYQDHRESEKSFGGQDFSDPPGVVQRNAGASDFDQNTVELNQEMFKDRVSKASVFLEENAGKKIAQLPMDENTDRLLHTIVNERERWTQTMEDDVGAALQLLYPDTGGTYKNGPI